MQKNGLLIQIGTKQAPDGIYAEIVLDGPIMLHGITSPATQQFIVPDKNGTSTYYQEGEQYPLKDPVALCRCGLSKNKPYCDGSHKDAAKY